MCRTVRTECTSVDGVVGAPSEVESLTRVGGTDAFGQARVGDGLKLTENA